MRTNKVILQTTFSKSFNYENRILCVGSPLIDVIAEVDHHFLSKFHLQQNDATIANKTHSTLFQELQKHHRPKLRIGGSVTNTTRTIQRLVETPKAVSYVGMVGNDRFGRMIEDALGQENVGHLLLKSNDATATGQCAVLVVGENRSMVTDLGASGRFSVTHLMRRDVRNLIEGAEYYYMSAFFLGVSYDAMLEIGRHSRAGAKTFILNIGAPFLCDKYRQELEILMPYVDVLAGNEAEARSLAKINGIVDDDAKTVAERLAKLGGRERTVIVTRGAGSVLVSQNDGVVFEFPVPQIESGQIVDTSGAGDGFMGGFVAGFVRSKSIEECVSGGICVAQEVIRNHGFHFD